MKAIRRFTVRTVLPPELAALETLVTNLRWSWHKPTRLLFKSMDPLLWSEIGQDPIAFLGAVSPKRLAELAADDEFVARANGLLADLGAYLSEPRWYQGLEGAPESIGYFSPEFGIAAALPQYSGGLGILAGDHLKAASDLGLPLIGVGLFYAAGYFRQSVSRDGWQQESYPVLDPDGMPLTLLRDSDGSAVRIMLALPRRRCAARARLDRERRQDQAAPPRHERARERRDPPGRHRSAVRRRRRAPAPPGGAPSASAASVRSRRTASCPARRSRRCSTRTRGTPASSASSGSPTSSARG